MNTYLLLCFIIVFLALLFYRNINSPVFLRLVFLALFVIYGFRDAFSIGIDSSRYGLYYGGYKQAGEMAISLTYNFGFYYLEKIVNKLTDGNYQIFITLIAAFVSYSYYRLVKKFSINSYISIMWFLGMLYYVFMFSALKQSIAMGVLTWAFDAAMEKKEARFYFLVILAGCFHFPAFIFLPAYWLSNHRINKLFLIGLGVLFGLVFIFRSEILAIMLSFYERGERLSSGNPTFFGNKVIFMVAILVIAVITRPQDDSENRLFSALINYMAIAALLQTFCYYNNIFERLADYYYHFSILFMPVVIKNIKNKPSRLMQLIGILGVVVITGFCIWRFNNYVTNTMPYYHLPYKFFWQ